MLFPLFQILAGVVLPYFAVGVFLAGVTCRMIAWQRLPRPAPMALFTAKGPGLGPIVKEALLFPSLRRGDRLLWTLAWVFHVTLAIAFLGHVRITTSFADRVLHGLGVGTIAMAGFSTLAGGAAGLVLMVAIVGLVARRLLLTRAREISSLPDFAALLLLTAVITSGNLLRWLGSPSELLLARAWIASLASLAPSAPGSTLLLQHAFFAEMLILYLAFSKLMHFGGFFMTFPLFKRTAP